MNITSLPYRQGIQAYIFNDKDELLLVCNAGDEKFWKAPSGGMEKGEVPEETLKREMMEELGVNVEIIKKMPFKNKYTWSEELIKKHNYNFKGQEQVLFAVKIRKGEKIKIDQSEIQDYKWVKFSEVNSVLKLKTQQEMAERIFHEVKIKEST